MSEFVVDSGPAEIAGPAEIVSDLRIPLYGSDDTRREMHPSTAVGPGPTHAPSWRLPYPLIS